MNKTKKPRLMFEVNVGLNQNVLAFYKGTTRQSLHILDTIFPVKPNSITVKIFSSTNGFTEIYGTAAIPDWLVAAIPNNSIDTILIRHSRIMALKKSERRRVITHELSHLYLNLLNKKTPDWLKEGIALYVAQQIYLLVVPQSSWAYITKNGKPFKGIPRAQIASHHGSAIAGLMVRSLVRRFGWKTFIGSISYIPNRPVTLTKIFQRLGYSEDVFFFTFQKDHIKKDRA